MRSTLLRSLWLCCARSTRFGFGSRFNKWIERKFSSFSKTWPRAMCNLCVLYSSFFSFSLSRSPATSTWHCWVWRSFSGFKVATFLFCLGLFRSVPFSLPLQLLFVHRIRLIVNFVSFSSRFNSIIFNGYVFDFKTNRIRYHVYTRRHFCLFRWQLKKWMRWERIQNERTSHTHNVHSLYSTQIYRTTNGFR